MWPIIISLVLGFILGCGATDAYYRLYIKPEIYKQNKKYTIALKKIKGIASEELKREVGNN